MFKNFKETLMNRFFTPVENIVWDMMSGNLGIKEDDGIVSLVLGDIKDGEAPDAKIVKNIFDGGSIQIPAFAQNTPRANLNLGDLIYTKKDKVLGWIVKKNEKSFRILKPNGQSSSWTPVEVQMLGFESGVMVLRSLLNQLPGGAAQLGQMNAMLMPMMMSGMIDIDDQDSPMGKMLPMLLMSQMNMGKVDPSTSGNTMANMMQMMMFSQMMGGSKCKCGDKKPNGRSFFDSNS